MTRTLLSLGLTALLSTTYTSATTVSILEFSPAGKSTVHRTTSTGPRTSSDGVLSFLRSLHEVSPSRKGRAVQYPGMSVVPNLFARPDGGMSIGIEGEFDLEEMPTVRGLLEESDENVIGNLEMNNFEGKRLLKQIKGDSIDAKSLEASISKRADAIEGNTLSSLSVSVDKESSAEVDASLSRSLSSIAQYAEKTGRTIVVHLIVEESDRSLDARASSRRLNEDESEDQDNNNNNNNNNNEGEEGDNGEFDYSKYGYQKANGVYYNPYRTMSQIQLYNIFLWTSVGLFAILYVANYMTAYMPLMPDTLLFGESAKVAAE